MDEQPTHLQQAERLLDEAESLHMEGIQSDAEFRLRLAEAHLTAATLATDPTH